MIINTFLKVPPTAFLTVHESRVNNRIVDLIVVELKKKD